MVWRYRHENTTLVHMARPVDFGGPAAHIRAWAIHLRLLDRPASPCRASSSKRAVSSGAELRPGAGGDGDSC
jgi:hypothetical protein